MTHLRHSLSVLLVFGLFLAPKTGFSDSKNAMTNLKNSMSQKDEAYNNYYKALRALDHPPTDADRQRLMSEHIVPAEVKEQNALRGLIESRLADHGITKYDPNSPEAKKKDPNAIPDFLKDKKTADKGTGTARGPAAESDKDSASRGQKKSRAAQKNGPGIDPSQIPKSVEYQSKPESN